ncbi:MAG: methionine synthase [Candidatus Marinimicrobia bacterium]|nr:methionine synthase [Candidatus Neomarinimicrobiota bacterium]
MMIFLERLKQDIILFDGAMGTQIHELNPSDAEWNGSNGCPEILNLTIPDKIQQIHENYLIAGADVIETNTFGANTIVLSEFDLQKRVVEINRKASEIAVKAVRNFSTPAKPRFVAGSLGPGTKLVSLGQTDFDTLYQSYSLQVRGLIEGGVDLFIIETCQDLLQIKAALIAIQDEMESVGVHLPRIVSLTIETSGTMLIGSDISTALAVLEPFDIDAIGINCATGPEQMRPYVRQICRTFPGPVLVQPNAGLPQNVNGEMVYALSIREYVDVLSGFIQEYGVQIVGGCCGTTPKFIEAIARKLPELKPAVRQPVMKPAVASLFTAQELHQDPAPFFVGERSNTNGSKKFRECLLANDWDCIVDISRQQEKTGAHGLDLCIAYTGRDEAADMHEAVTRIVKQVNLPIFIDSTDVKVIEKALKLIGGRAVINSINLEDGEERTRKVCRLAKRYGAAVIALTIDEAGMAHEVAKKVEIANRIFEIAVNQIGLRPQDLIFDTLTFTLGSGDESLKDAGKNTIDGIRAIKKALPGVFTILGVSNISFGLHAGAREILNSVFLSEAIGAGLDLAIVNVKKILPLYKLDRDDIDICRNLIYNRGREPLLKFIDHFDKKAGVKKVQAVEDDQTPVDKKIRQRVIQGNRSGLEKLLIEALETSKAIDIINNQLIPAMKDVGELFGSGKMQLPFVLQSAEVMKFAVEKLKPFLGKADTESKASIVLATVRGDVHDIGKNLVDIILSNNGYKVYNLGIKCEIDTILQKAMEVKADAIGMSGLLVKSTVVMKENLEIMQRRRINIPVLLGGAALPRSFVDDVCAPIIDAPVVYCTDAFEGLKAMSRIKENKTGKQLNNLKKSTDKPAKTLRQKSDFPDGELRYDISIPVPPFWGTKIIDDVNLDAVFAYLSESVLFQGRWGYRRGNLSREEYNELIEKKVQPEFESLKQRCKAEKLLVPRVVYGYFPCNSVGEKLVIFEPGSNREILRFHFPRQKKAPFRSIADFFLPAQSERRDIIPVQIVTVGQQASAEAQRLYKSNAYKDYLLFHGLSVETAEALAKYWHRQIRVELNIVEKDGSGNDDFIAQKYRGSRYSFGYPACPDLAGNRLLIQLLRAERIGVAITEGNQMTPEQTTSAFIVHHPQAKYFTLE